MFDIVCSPTHTRRCFGNRIDVRELFSIKKLIGTVMRRENWNLSFNVSLIKESSQSQGSFAFEDYMFFQLNMTRLVLKMEWNILSFFNKVEKSDTQCRFTRA